MYAVSLSVRPSVKLNIHNQCLNTDLTSLIYVTGDELEAHRAPDYKVYAGNIMRSSFAIDKSGNASYGVLMYRLQRRQLHTSSATHLLIVWRISESKKLCADVLLVEHDKDHLRALHGKNVDRFKLCSDSATEAWSLDDHIALMTRFKIANEDCTLDITISEVERDLDARMPARVDPER
jgi:hypothetical protein